MEQRRKAVEEAKAKRKQERHTHTERERASIEEVGLVYVSKESTYCELSSYRKDE